jgi:hypothetical protein
MNVSPVPTSDQAEISFTVIEPADISLKIYSVDGRMVKDVETGKRNTGSYEVIIPTCDFPNGSYYIILNVGKETLRRNLLIVR